MCRNLLRGILKSGDDSSEVMVTNFYPVMEVSALKTFMLLKTPWVNSKFSIMFHVLSGMDARLHSFRQSVSHVQPSTALCDTTTE